MRKTLPVVGIDGPDHDRAPIPQSFRYLVFAWFHSQPDTTPQLAGRVGIIALGFASQKPRKLSFHSK
jgi:hypothetical protein